MQIQVNVNNLTLIKSDELNENEYNIHNIQFTFSNEYSDNLAKVALFTGNSGTYKVIITNNECNIPAEILANKDCFTLGVYAFDVENDELIERFSPSPIKLYILDGSYIPDEETENSEPITPTDKEQILAELAQLELDAIQIATNTQDISNIKTKLNGIEAGAEVNIIETIKVNNVALTPVNKAVNVEVPIKTSDITNDSGFITKEVNNLTNYTLKTSTGSKIQLEIDNTTYKLKSKLYDINNNLISTSSEIDLPIESMIINASYSNGILTLTLQNGNTLNVDISSIISGLQQEITSENKLASDLVDDTNQTNKFATSEQLSQINTNKNNITTLQGNVVDINAEQLLQNARITELEEEVEDLQNNQLTGTAEGTEIDLTDSADSRVKSIELEGNSTQETTEGKNLWGGFTYSSSEYNVSFNYYDNGTIKANGTASSNAVSGTVSALKNNGIYKTLSAGTYAVSKNSSDVQLQVYDVDTTTQIKNLTTTVNEGTFTLTEETDVTIRIMVPANVTVTELVVEIMLNEDSTIEPYEKYTGGIPSPNPSYSQPIYSAGDNGTITEKIVNKNWFINNWEQGNINGNTGVSENSTSRVRTKDFIRVFPNVGYYMSRNVTDNYNTYRFYDKNLNYLGNNTTENMMSTNTPNNNIPANVSDTIFVILNTKVAYMRVVDISNNLNTKYLLMFNSETDKTFVPHQEQTFTIPTQQPMREIEDVKDFFFKNVQGSEYYDSTLTENAWYERHYLDEITLNGEITIVRGTDQNLTRYELRGVIPLMKQNQTRTDILSNYFHFLSSGREVGLCFAFWIYSGSIFVYPEQTITTVEAMQEWLNENKPKFIYPLATPTNLPCTSEQTQALESYVKARTYKPVTHFYSEDVTPAYQEVVYVKDLETYQASIESRLEALETEV